MKGNIKVPYLARVEGEGGIEVSVRDGKVKVARFKIFEPPRFFEAFLKGRDAMEVPDITARICGICPVAYQISSCNAIENALHLEVTPEIRRLRRLLYCGEWIESHLLHAFFLHAPDFLGYEDAFEMARDHEDLVKTALGMKRTGNMIVSIVGGREIHPINVRVGGFYRAPRRDEIERLIPGIDDALERLPGIIRLVGGIEVPKFERDYEFVSMRSDVEYPMAEGRIVSSKGMDIEPREYDHNFTEEHLPYTTSLVSKIRGRGSYLVGPLARFNLNFDRLDPMVRDLAEEISVVPPVKNPFVSMIVRLIETYQAFIEASRIVRDYEEPEASFVEVVPRSAAGFGLSEAPRGILFHRYRMDEGGRILGAKIVPPTSQNQAAICEDLEAYTAENLDMEKDLLTHRLEQAVRNYDPCISCSVHSLRVKILLK